MGERFSFRPRDVSVLHYCRRTHCCRANHHTESENVHCTAGVSAVKTHKSLTAVDNGTAFGVETRKRRHHLGDQGADGRAVLTLLNLDENGC